VVHSKEPARRCHDAAYDKGVKAAGIATRPTVTDPAGRATACVYDNGSLTKKVQDPKGASPRSWSYENSAVGDMPTRVTDPNGRSVLMTYTPAATGPA